MKTLTRKQLEKRKAQAVRFVRDVLQDEERADEIDDESIEDYAAHKRIQIKNPKGVTRMAAPSRRELLDKIDELQAENEDLQAQIDEIADIVVPAEDDDQGSDEDEDDQGED